MVHRRRESRASMREKCSSACEQTHLNTLSCCIHQTFGSNCWRLQVRIPLNEAIVLIHVCTQHVCMLFFCDDKDEGRTEICAASVHMHFTSVRAFLHARSAVYLCWLTCTHWLRVCLRGDGEGGRKTRALWIGPETVSQRGRTKDGERWPAGKWMSARIFIEHASVEGDNADGCHQLFCYPGSLFSAIVYSYCKHKTVSTDKCIWWDKRVLMSFPCDVSGERQTRITAW